MIYLNMVDYPMLSLLLSTWTCDIFLTQHLVLGEWLALILLIGIFGLDFGPGLGPMYFQSHQQDRDQDQAMSNNGQLRIATPPRVDQEPRKRHWKLVITMAS